MASITVREVPDDARDELAARAARSGRSLQEYLRMSLRVDLFPFEPFADRAWALRETVTAYDAWYVAMAEALSVPLATLDGRLSRAPGPRCTFELPNET